MFHEYIDTLYIAKPLHFTFARSNRMLIHVIHEREREKKNVENAKMGCLFLTTRLQRVSRIKAKNRHIIRKGLYIRRLTPLLISHFQPYHEIRPSFNESRPSNVFLIAFIRAFLHIYRRHARCFVCKSLYGE